MNRTRKVEASSEWSADRSEITCLPTVGCGSFPPMDPMDFCSEPDIIRTCSGHLSGVPGRF